MLQPSTVLAHGSSRPKTNIEVKRTQKQLSFASLTRARSQTTLYIDLADLLVSKCSSRLKCGKTAKQQWIEASAYPSRLGTQNVSPCLWFAIQSQSNNGKVTEFASKCPTRKRGIVHMRINWRGWRNTPIRVRSPLTKASVSGDTVHCERIIKTHWKHSNRPQVAQNQERMDCEHAVLWLRLRVMLVPALAVITTMPVRNFVYDRMAHAGASSLEGLDSMQVLLLLLPWRLPRSLTCMRTGKIERGP